MATLALCVMLLAGCAEETTEDRRFANEPAPTQDQPTATIAPPSETEPAAPTAVPASPETLLQARGAPARFYLSVGNELWAVSGGETRRLPLPPGASILALDGSPSGDRVALATADQSGQVALQILDAEGQVLRIVGEVVSAAATPEAIATASDRTEPAAFVDWGLQGDTILVGTADGRLSAVPVTGEPRLIPVDLGGGRLLGAQVSPRGDSIALLRHDPDDVTRLLVMRMDTGGGGQPRTIAPREGGESRTVRQMAWLPDGDSMLYVEGPVVPGGIEEASELFQVQLAGLRRKLVATGGEAGPAGSVLDFQASPDGKSVAYVIGLPEGDDVAVHSMWIDSLAGPTQYRVPINESMRITGIHWTRDGLTWGVETPEPSGGSALVLYRVGRDGAVESLSSIAVEQPDGTPPLASPQASPAAST